MVRRMYKCGNDIVPDVNSFKFGLNFWRGMCNIWTEFYGNLGQRLGNGIHVNFLVGSVESKMEVGYWTMI